VRRRSECLGSGRTMPASRQTGKVSMAFQEFSNTPNGISIPGAALALMPLPLVIQYRLKAGKLSICPSQRIYVQASRPGLNKIPFQLVQLFANHKTNSYADRTFNAKRKAN
jgi:hypothetical protein